ncbi:MAG: methionyl-tRNA formyltransferase [Gammaproteobacteria bacterium]|nr:methionyl-tRNA formyltransferase [Gammaproteobacteria bacterium]
MRIIVNGQQAFGRSVLDALLDRGEEVVGVFTAPDAGGRPDPLKEGADERGIPVFQPKSFRREAVWEQIRELEPDLGVMAYVTLFVPEEALNIPTHGTIQYHPSLLPMHKGPSSINWPIIFGETKTGLSIFWPDDGLDTGPVLLQREVAIGPDDTLGSVYFDHLFPLGVDAMIEAVDRVREGRAPKTPQWELAGGEAEVDPSELGTYEGWCRAEQAEIDWGEPAATVYNLIRGSNPQPGAWTTYEGSQLQIFDSRKVDGTTPGEAGTVTGVGDDGFEVAAGEGSIKVMRVRPAGQGKVPAAEFAATAGLRVGYRFKGA